MKVIAHIMPKKNLLDPEGATIERAMHALGHDKATNVRVGKIIEFAIEGESSSKLLSQKIDQLCQELLSNPNIEDYRYEIQDAD